MEADLPLLEGLFSCVVGAMEYPDWHEGCLSLSNEDLSLQD